MSNTIISAMRADIDSRYRKLKGIEDSNFLNYFSSEILWEENFFGYVAVFRFLEGVIYGKGLGDRSDEIMEGVLKSFGEDVPQKVPEKELNIQAVLDLSQSFREHLDRLLEHGIEVINDYRTEE
jgi:hypothetical protein